MISLAGLIKEVSIIWGSLCLLLEVLAAIVGIDEPVAKAGATVVVTAAGTIDATIASPKFFVVDAVKPAIALEGEAESEDTGDGPCDEPVPEKMGASSVLSRGQNGMITLE